ncbi:MAG: RNA-binding S4 domain-containing protein [Armatimonadota bacterium]|nr:RNA-binding S4 domain-containing protein [Armatimonadota bacterium]MDR7438895.1 RNA-binding S4 domain-containing protein [Armatimonadota bacterium]MDR7562435.1 RNA-binding S4 domain-containing protein [Armatimonadota bacterium]MDR7568856.1 RNA-binding S4 domain-containing protein [Armatimonadota bacterium]MDR7601515.1 RNA-binding S4 domain-containing protein [Armatimonadota bacterium]
MPIRTPAIALGAFLKWAQVVRSGGEAKHWIRAGRVRVNGQVERRRGRVLRPGDVVEVEGRVLVVRAGRDAGANPLSP